MLLEKLNLFKLSLIAAFNKIMLGPHVWALIIKSENGLFAVDPEDHGVGRKLRIYGRYGCDELKRLKSYITLDSRVLIVGAHIGTLAIPISKLCKEVFAIEANPITYNLLTLNITLNSAFNCRAINVAASDKSENINFLLSRVNSGGSKRVPKIHNLIYYYDNPEKISIKAVSLDQYLKDQNIFDIIVMDIEGSEWYALRGMQNILSKCKLLVIEFLPHHLKNVSGVTVEQFLSLIAPHFSKLTIPSKQIILDSSDFVRFLNEMYDLDQGDDGIIFEKI